MSSSKPNPLATNLSDFFNANIDKRAEPLQDEFINFNYAPTMDLLQRREKIACLDKVLTAERLKHKEKLKGFKQRWIAAANQMKETDLSILKFEKHYIEAQDHRDHFLGVAERMEDLNLNRLKEIRQLTLEKGVLKDVKSMSERRLSKFQNVEKYLENVRDNCQGEFKSIRELLERFNLLRETRANLLERDEEADAKVRKKQQFIKGLSVFKENETVLLNNYIFEMTEGLESLVEKEQRLSEDLMHVKSSAAQRAMTLGSVRMATYNLYRQACHMMGRVAKIPPTDTVRQLNYIQGSLVEINKLRKQLKHILKQTLALNLQNEKKNNLLMESKSRGSTKTGMMRDDHQTLAKLFKIKDNEEDGDGKKIK